MTEPRDEPRQDLSIASGSEQETVALGRALGASLSHGDAVLLTGELGAGKTTLVRGMAQGTGSPEPARSPTFVLLIAYPGALTLHHCDLYRIASEAEADDLALDECLEDGALVVEWAERARNALPRDALQVAFDVDVEADVRTISFLAGGPASDSLLQRTVAAIAAPAPRPEPAT